MDYTRVVLKAYLPSDDMDNHIAGGSDGNGLGELVDVHFHHRPSDAVLHHEVHVPVLRRGDHLVEADDVRVLQLLHDRDLGEERIPVHLVRNPRREGPAGSSTGKGLAKYLCGRAERVRGGGGGGGASRNERVERD